MTTSQYMRLRPGDRCACVTAQIFGHSIIPWGALQLQAATQQQGPSGRHTPPTSAIFPCCQPGSAVLLYSWEARGRALHTRHTPTRASAALQGCHGELQQRQSEILQQFSPLPQLFFPLQLALQSATADPVLKRTGNGKMLLTE